MITDFDRQISLGLKMDGVTTHLSPLEDCNDNRF